MKDEALAYTYEDYANLPDDKRCELIDGEFYLNPAPTPYHQEVSAEIELLLRNHVRANKLGKVYDAPIDVVLSDTDVLQPDILFISAERLGIVGEKYVQDAPDLVVEVLSPSTASRDRTIKKKTYGRAGVREYWLVDPKTRRFEQWVRGDAELELRNELGADDSLRSVVLPGFAISPLRVIFETD